MGSTSSISTWCRTVKVKPGFIAFTWFVRILLALAFIAAGLHKLGGGRVVADPIDTPIGFFFEAIYRASEYYTFIGIVQLTAGLFLVFPWTTTLGTLLYLPVISSIFMIVIALDFPWYVPGGFPFLTGMMLLANLYLLAWDYDRLRGLVPGFSPRVAS